MTVVRTAPRIALVGPPNCGSTALFNRLTVVDATRPQLGLRLAPEVLMNGA